MPIRRRAAPTSGFGAEYHEIGLATDISGLSAVLREHTMWDSHVHLAAYPDPARVVAHAARRGIRLVSVTVATVEAAPNLRLRATTTGLRCFLGVHPSEATKSPIDLSELNALWDSADGVGEVGLDPKYSDTSGASKQMELFRAQVHVASRKGKPLQVHSRGAEAACLDEVDGFSLRSVLFHWFESEELLDRAVGGNRRFVSFGPAVIYSKRLQRIAARCPPESVLTESDGPVGFAAIAGAEGPGLIPSVVFKLAELWHIPWDETVSRISKNSETYLG